MKNLLFLCYLLPAFCVAQMKWENVDGSYAPLPPGVHVFSSHDPIDGKAGIAYYVVADLKDRNLEFDVQVGNGKRYTPSAYFEQEGHPLLVMNCTFFEFVHNSNQNVVVRNGVTQAYQVHTINGRGKDTFTYRHPFGSAIGIGKNRKADVAWLYTDSSSSAIYASESPVAFLKDSIASPSRKYMLSQGRFRKWKMQTAVGGGPVLLQGGEIKVTNNEELKFTGNAINDRHPRTAMGYTPGGKLIMLVIEGRHPGKAEGATLTQEAQILKDLGCTEALNLDGGGSSCLLLNGKETITPSEKGEQRPVPAVFLIRLHPPSSALSVE